MKKHLSLQCKAMLMFSSLNDGSRKREAARCLLSAEHRGLHKAVNGRKWKQDPPYPTLEEVCEILNDDRAGTLAFQEAALKTFDRD